MRSDEVKKALSKFSKNVIKQSRSNLTRKGKNVTRKGYESLKYDLRVHRNSFSLDFEMEDYMQYQDQGIKGSKSTYAESKNSPFKYKKKQPPLEPIMQWAKRRGIQGRDKKGRFITNKSLSYLIARSIFSKGIKASMFFTKPFEQNFKKLPDELIEAFGLDLEELFKTTT